MAKKAITLNIDLYTADVQLAAAAFTHLANVNAEPSLNVSTWGKKSYNLTLHNAPNTEEVKEALNIMLDNDRWVADSDDV